MEMYQLFQKNGPVHELELDEELQEHLKERGTYDKHIVTFTEILEAFTSSPKFFLNSTGLRAPLVMIGPTNHGRFLVVPIEPSGKFGIWRPVTAFTANAHHRQRYIEGE